MNCIAIGSDHGGFTLKERIKLALAANWIDVGAHDTQSSNYAEFAHAVAKKVQNREADYGILICRSGIGVSITANRYKGVFAALCLNETMAKSARSHNNANVICLAADTSNSEEAKRLIEVFLSTAFEAGGRHEFRLSSIDSDLI